MIINLKKYFIGLVYRYKTKVITDFDFYEDYFYLSDMESDFYV